MSILFHFIYLYEGVSCILSLIEVFWFCYTIGSSFDLCCFLAIRSFASKTNQTVLVALYPGGEAGKNNPNILGCDANELGLRSWLEERGHNLIVTTDKDDPGCEFEKHLPEANVVISQPFWPAYITAERINQAPNLKLAVTAGVFFSFFLFLLSPPSYHQPSTSLPPSHHHHHHLFIVGWIRSCRSRGGV